VREGEEREGKSVGWKERMKFRGFTG